VPRHRPAPPQPCPRAARGRCGRCECPFRGRSVTPTRSRRPTAATRPIAEPAHRRTRPQRSHRAHPDPGSTPHPPPPAGWDSPIYSAAGHPVLGERQGRPPDPAIEPGAGPTEAISACRTPTVLPPALMNRSARCTANARQAARSASLPGGPRPRRCTPPFANYQRPRGATNPNARGLRNSHTSSTSRDRRRGKRRSSMIPTTRRGRC
jgi:hypothetical protein